MMNLYVGGWVDASDPQRASMCDHVLDLSCSFYFLLFPIKDRYKDRHSITCATRRSATPAEYETRCLRPVWLNFLLSMALPQAASRFLGKKITL
jgi:hypothetical protein